MSARLNKQYGKFTPAERVPLLVDASAREDEPELFRLMASAPRLTCHVPDFHGLREGLMLAAQMHALATMDLIVQFERFCIHLAELNAIDLKDKSRCDRMLSAARFTALLIVVRIDSWRLFCAGLGIDPLLPMQGLPGGETIVSVEAEARAIAFTTAEATGWMRGRGKESPVPSAKDVAKTLSELADRCAAVWS